jgi:hypothetical protein
MLNSEIDSQELPLESILIKRICSFLFRSFVIEKRLFCKDYLKLSFRILDMTKTACIFDMSRYAPKSEEERRTFDKSGYRTLPLEEALEYAKIMKQLTVGDKKIKNLFERLKEGSSELRYYKEGAKDIEGEKGNRIFLYIKPGIVVPDAEIVTPSGGVVLATTLRSEKEVKELPNILELEESK